MNTLEDVLELWQSDPEFREQFNKNPQQALKTNEIQLNDGDFKKIQSYVARLNESGTGGDDQELEKRISK
jgi:hypothetical protein